MIPSQQRSNLFISIPSDYRIPTSIFFHTKMNNNDYDDSIKRLRKLFELSIRRLINHKEMVKYQELERIFKFDKETNNILVAGEKYEVNLYLVEYSPI